MNDDRLALESGCTKPCNFDKYEVAQNPFGRTMNDEVSLIYNIHIYIYNGKNFIVHSKEFMNFSGFSLLAEMGGFLGLFLGVSFFDIFTSGVYNYVGHYVSKLFKQ